MTVSINSDAIVLPRACAVEEAETLRAALLDHPGLPVEVAALERAHLAVIQVLLVAGRALRGVPADPLLRDVALASLLPSPTTPDATPSGLPGSTI